MQWKDLADGEIVELFRDGVQCGIFEKIEFEPPCPVPTPDGCECDCAEPLMNAWSPKTSLMHICPDEKIEDQDRDDVLANRDFTGYILFKNFARAAEEQSGDN